MGLSHHRKDPRLRCAIGGCTKIHNEIVQDRQIYRQIITTFAFEAESFCCECFLRLGWILSKAVVSAQVWNGRSPHAMANMLRLIPNQPPRSPKRNQICQYVAVMEHSAILTICVMPKHHDQGVEVDSSVLGAIVVRRRLDTAALMSCPWPVEHVYFREGFLKRFETVSTHCWRLGCVRLDINS